MIELLLQAESALSVGLLDRAESLYRRVADADPRNSIAVVGLARVALERSDKVGALTLARRALSIDPENDAARRMVQRLEEVLRVRGVSVSPAPAVQPAEARPAADARPTEQSTEQEAVATQRGNRSYLDRLLRRRRG